MSPVAARRNIGGFLFILTFLALLPVIAPVGTVISFFHRRRMLRIAEITNCSACGICLGPAATRLSDERCRQEAIERRKKFPGVIFRIIRDVHAICPACGAELTWFAASRSFRLKEPAALPA